MAQGIKYQMRFRSRNEIDYVVNIYQQDYTGTATLLSGATTSPFVTEEIKDTDILAPIRTQSGYLRIVTSRDVWLDIINNCSMVKLMRGRVVEWGGYINKEAFNGDAFEPVKEYQIPIHCILSHLRSFRFVVSPFNSPTFAQILHEAFSNFPELYPDEMAWAKMLSSDNTPKFLECRFQRSNFYDESEKADEDEVIKSESTYYDVISEICKYFGIVLCVQRTRLLFTDGYGGDCYLASTQDLIDIDSYGADSVHVLNQIIADNSSLFEFSYVSANNQESVLQPVKDVKIEGDINPYDDFDGTYPKESIDEWVDKNYTQIYYQDSQENRTYFRDFEKEYHAGTSERGEYDYPYQYQQYDSDTVTLKLYKYSGASAPDHYGDINSLDITKQEDVPTKLDYSFDNLIYVHVSALAGYNPVFGLYGKHDVSLGAYSGAINLDFSVMEDTGNSQIQWVLKVGKYYWNGSAWVDTFHAFTTEFNGVECKTNRTLSDGYDGKRGVIIPINMNLSGKISLELLNSVEGTTRLTNYFTKLTLEYVRKNNQKNGTDTTIEETATTGVDSLEDYSQSCVFATSPKVNGYGAVLDFNGSPLTSYSYRNLPTTPERHRLNIVSAVKRRPQSVLDIDISDDDTLVDRYETVSASGVWPDYSILSLSHDWAESKLQVKLIQTSSV